MKTTRRSTNVSCPMPHTRPQPRFGPTETPCNVPPYLFHIANWETDAPSALAFIQMIDKQHEEILKEQWSDYYAGIQADVEAELYAEQMRMQGDEYYL